MKELTITITGDATVRLQTRPSGDIEVVSSRNNGASGGVYDHKGKPQRVMSGGVTDTLLTLIPANKRCEVAEFLAQA